MRELSEILREYKEAYYNGTPMVSDAEFDTLEEQLRDEDPTNVYFELVGSPTLAENKRQHNIPMGSQAKCKIDDGGLEKINNDFYKKGRCIASYKMDGISVAVDYIDGVFQHATTRGDGHVGENITDATDIVFVREQLYEPMTGTLRGEIVLHYADFERINAELSEDEKFSNPRNAVSGIVRKENSPYKKDLRVYYFDVIDEDITFETKLEKFRWISDIVISMACVTYFEDDGFESFADIASNLDNTRKELPFMIDGLVVEFDDLAYYDSLGVANGNKPRGSVALKFNAVAEKTIVTDIVWQVGSTGNLTPVVEFEPTLIDGSVVRRASIHNYDIFTQWGFSKGDVITVQKNNDIIPQVNDVVTYSDSGLLEAPKYCPVCGVKLEILRGDTKNTRGVENLVCVNPLCEAKYVGAIKKWCTKAGMATKGVGDAFFASYAENYESITEIYSIDAEDIIRMSERYKEKSSTKIYNAIQSSKIMKLMNFFGGLNVHGAGSRTFKKIIDHSGCKTVKELRDYILSNPLDDIDGIGEITATIIKNGVDNCEFIIDVFSEIITIEKEDEVSADAESFLFTGKFSTKRKDLEAMVVSSGGKISSSVNKSLDYLVQSDPTSQSSKSKKAEKLGIPIINEEEFLTIIRTIN